jgi:hypothetical protein
VPTDPQSLFDQGKCFICFGATEVDLVSLALYAQIANGPPLGLPITPGSFDIADSSTTASINLTWTNLGPGTSTEIYKSTDGTTYNLQATVGSGISTYSDIGGLPVQTLWYYKIRSVNALGNSAFTYVRSAGNQLVPGPVNNDFYSNDTMVVHFGQWDGGGNNFAGIVHWGVCRRCTGQFKMNDALVLTTIDMPALVTLSGNLQLSTTGPQVPLQTLNFPSLVTLSGDLAINDCHNLQTATFTSLRTITGQVGASNTIGLTSLDLQSLQTIGVGFFLIGATSITNLLLNNMVTSGTQFYTQNSTNLSIIRLASWIMQNASTINCSGCAIGVGFGPTGAGIDGILARGVASPALTGCTINLTGGTNATPSASGLVDKATLNGQGNVVTTN